MKKFITRLLLITILCSLFYCVFVWGVQRAFHNGYAAGFYDMQGKCIEISVEYIQTCELLRDGLRECAESCTPRPRPADEVLMPDPVETIEAELHELWLDLYRAVLFEHCPPTHNGNRCAICDALLAIREAIDASS